MLRLGVILGYPVLVTLGYELIRANRTRPLHFRGLGTLTLPGSGGRLRRALVQRHEWGARMDDRELKRFWAFIDWFLIMAAPDSYSEAIVERVASLYPRPNPQERQRRSPS
jgi:hypothetical protein